MLAFGIDTATTTIGLAVVRDGVMVYAKSVDLTRKGSCSFGERLKNFRTCLDMAEWTYGRPNEVAYEKVHFRGKNVRASQAVGAAMGVVDEWCSLRNIVPVQKTVTEVKRAAGFAGNTKKELVEEQAKVDFGLHAGADAAHAAYVLVAAGFLEKGERLGHATGNQSKLHAVRSPFSGTTSNTNSNGMASRSAVSSATSGSRPDGSNLCGRAEASRGD